MAFELEKLNEIMRCPYINCRSTDYTVHKKNIGDDKQYPQYKCKKCNRVYTYYGSNSLERWKKPWWLIASALALETGGGDNLADENIAYIINDQLNLTEDEVVDRHSINRWHRTRDTYWARILADVMDIEKTIWYVRHRPVNTKKKSYVSTVVGLYKGVKSRVILGSYVGHEPDSIIDVKEAVKISVEKKVPKPQYILLDENDFPCIKLNENEATILSEQNALADALTEHVNIEKDRISYIYELNQKDPSLISYLYYLL